MIPDPTTHAPTASSDGAPARRAGGVAGRLASALCAGLSLYALYWVLFIVQPQVYRVSFLLVALVLTFLLFPFRKGDLSGVSPLDWVLIGATVVALSWPILDFGAFIYRAAEPGAIDLALGGLTVLLVLEATRRSVGPILPVAALAAGLGGWARGPIAPAERVFLVIAGLAMFAAQPALNLGGLGVTAVVLFLHFRWHSPVRRTDGSR